MNGRTDKPFFVPQVKEGMDEEAYRHLAKIAGCVPAPPQRRVYSIVFGHNGETWVAAVGEKLRGTKTVTKGRGRSRVDREVPVYNEATVMAIFDHVPFIVCHDGASREWANPFLAGKPRSVTYFAAPAADTGPDAAQDQDEK
jgi:hypothetical protein